MPALIRVLATPRRALRAALAAGLAALAACEAPVLALGSTPRAAAANTDTLVTALAARFGPLVRDARLDSVRARFATSALVPSNLFRDDAVWTETAPDTRLLTIAGSGTPNHYALAIAENAPEPAMAAPAAYRRDTRLTRLGGDDWQWDARDVVSIGSATANELSAALTAVFLGAERGDERSAREAYRAQLPKTMAVLGQLFSLDSLHITPNTQGGSDVRITTTMHPDRLAAAFPQYAKYLDKYATPSDYDIRVYDDRGRDWWRTEKRGAALTLALRVHNGSLAPLAGPPDTMPPRLHVRIDASTKSWIFRVGLEKLIGDVTLVRAPHEKAFTVTFLQEPDWKLPPLVEQMLRSPLKRPFQPPGARLMYGVRDAPGRQTITIREYSIAVRESGIMRWFGGLGSSAVGDFREGAEREYDRFDADVFLALRTDLLALAREPAAQGEAGPRN